MESIKDQMAKALVKAYANRDAIVEQVRVILKEQERDERGRFGSGGSSTHGAHGDDVSVHTSNGVREHQKGNDKEAIASFKSAQQSALNMMDTVRDDHMGKGDDHWNGKDSKNGSSPRELENKAAIAASAAAEAATMIEFHKNVGSEKTGRDAAAAVGRADAARQSLRSEIAKDNGEYYKSGAAAIASQLGAT